MLRTKLVTVSQDNRDRGKTFEIVEMPADQAEWWAVQAIMAIGKNNPEIGDLAEAGANPMQGMREIARLGFQSFFKLNPKDIKPLLDEMMDCVWFLPSGPSQPNIRRRPQNDDIMEVSTRLMLRMEVFTLHTGFSLPAVTTTGSNSKTVSAG